MNNQKKPPVIEHDEVKFKNEAKEIVVSSMIANHSLDNIVLELNALKYAYNSTFADCAIVIFHAFLDKSKSDSDPNNTLNAFVKILGQWKDLLAKFVTSEEDQVEIIWALQDYIEVEGKQGLTKIFEKIIHKLYECDILEEEAILSWVDQEQEEKTYVDLCKNFLTWLQQSAEESEEEDDDEDAEEEEEEEEE